MAYSERFEKFIEIWQNEFAIERSMDEKLCADKNGQPLPWYTYPAIEYLSQFDYRDKKVFEFGCGYSSSFWAGRAKLVRSVEDNQEWFARWKNEFSANNLDILLREESPVYEGAINETSEVYDVIVIDGKRREKCAAVAVEKLVEGGVVILDDSDRVNTSREYVQAVEILREANLIQIDFYGFCPMNNYTKTTSLFLSRDFNFRSRYDVQPINGIGNLWGLGRSKRKEFFKKFND